MDRRYRTDTIARVGFAVLVLRPPGEGRYKKYNETRIFSSCHLRVRECMCVCVCVYAWTSCGWCCCVVLSSFPTVCKLQKRKKADDFGVFSIIHPPPSTIHDPTAVSSFGCETAPLKLGGCRAVPGPDMFRSARLVPFDQPLRRTETNSPHQCALVDWWTIATLARLGVVARQQAATAHTCDAMRHTHAGPEK